MQRCRLQVSILSIRHTFNRIKTVVNQQRYDFLLLFLYDHFPRFTEDSMHFKGSSVDADKHYEVTLNFLHKINPDKVVSKNTARCIEFTINKAESGPYWTSLTNDKKKPHFLKADFNKWHDEDSDLEEGKLWFEQADCFFFSTRIVGS